MSNSFNKSDIPPWWDKKRMVSKTNDSGNPIFEEESEPLPMQNPQLDLPFEKKEASLSKLANILSERYRLD